jgi:aspartyl-tRNA(Asn)/glutamyl-tRNA(Gln) amidotransferase subunit A
MDSIFVYINPETAVPESGDLQGMRVAIQPNISVAGWPADAVSKALHNFKALEDATIVQRLRQAGAFIPGSTRMSEFGLSLENSQAGEAIRQQAAEAELVMDFMGESRLAAARAAVCGFKPSFGLVPRTGLIGLIPSMECCGILSGSLEVIRRILKAAAGKDGLDFSMPDEVIPDFTRKEINPLNVTIGIIKEAQKGLSDRQEKDFQMALEELSKAGFVLKDVSFPDFSLFTLVHKIVGSVEASSSAGRYDSVRFGQRAPGAKNWNEMYLMSRGAAFGRLLKSFLFQGAFFQFEHYKAFEDACRIRARLLKEMQTITSQVDFLVLPAAGYTPSESTTPLTEVYARFSSTAFANVTGQPALYLPPASGAAEVGYQLVGPRLSDAGLLALGEFLLNLRQGGK